MRFSDLVRNLLSRPVPTIRSRNARKRTSRLRVERLEDRTVPSTVTWVNPSGGDWDTGSNWSTGQVPGAGDDAVISYSGITVTHDTNASDTVNSITSQATLEVSAGSLTVARPSTLDDLILSGGAFNSDSNVSIEGPDGFPLNTGSPSQSGPFTFLWLNGTLGGDGTVTLAQGTTAELGNYSSSLDGVTLVNQGDALLVIMTMTDGASLINQGNVDVWPNSVLGGSGSFTNQAGATVEKNPIVPNATETTATIGVPFDNAGTVALNQGTLVFNGTVTNAGSIVGASGTSLGFNGNLTSTGSISGYDVSLGNATLSGSYAATDSTTVGGTVTFSACTVSIADNSLVIYGGSLDLTGATLVDGTGNPVGTPANPLDLDDLYLQGTLLSTAYIVVNGPDGFPLNTGSPSQSGPFTFLWLNGTLGGDGTVTLAQGTTAELGNYSSSLDGVTLVNQGDALLVIMTMTDGASLINQGNVDVWPNSVLGGSGSFTNQAGATVEKNPIVPNATETTATIGVPFDNAGTVALNQGTLVFNGTVTNAGSITADPGTVLGFEGSVSASSTSVIQGDQIEFEGAASLAGSYSASSGTSLTEASVTFAPGSIVDPGNALYIYLGSTLDLTQAALVDGSGVPVGTSAADPLDLGQLYLDGTLLTDAFVAIGGGVGYAFNTDVSEAPGTFQLLWVAGTLGGDTITLEPGADSLVGWLTSYLAADLTNQGNAIISGELLFQNSATLTNDASLQVWGDANVQAGGSAAQLINSGSIVKEDPPPYYTTAGTATINVPFTNEAGATVELAHGSLDFAAVSNAGSISGQPGTTLNWLSANLVENHRTCVS